LLRNAVVRLQLRLLTEQRAVTMPAGQPLRRFVRVSFHAARVRTKETPMISTERSLTRRVLAAAATAGVVLVLAAAPAASAADHSQDNWWYNNNHKNWQGN